MIRKSSAILSCVITAVVTAVLCLSITGGVALLYLSADGRLGAKSAGDYARLDELRNLIHDKALWDTSDEKLLDNAAKGIMYGEKDIYATYFSPDEYTEFSQEEEGNYVGIGASVNVDTQDGLVTLVHIYKNSPAATAGLMPNDKIVGVAGQDIRGMELDAVVKLVRGEEGSTVELSVLRNEEVKNYTVERRAVTMDRVEWHMIDDKIGFIQIIEFNGNAYTLFSQALQELQAQGMQGLVLDLRNNPGGNYDLVVAIADRLLPEGPIVTLVDKNGKELDRRDSDANQLGIPMVVLVNQYSASASELLAGNIKDYGVGTLVGVTTYGKGVGQNFYKFDDGAVARYTAFEYRTGGGNCPQGVGIQPDIPVELNEEALNNPLLRNTSDDSQYMAALTELQKKMNPAP